MYCLWSFLTAPSGETDLQYWWDMFQIENVFLKEKWFSILKFSSKPENSIIFLIPCSQIFKAYVAAMEQDMQQIF